jgi:hypothetical protein
MNRHCTTKNLVLIGWIVLLTPAHASTNAPAHVYPSGIAVAAKIGNDLVASLDPKFRMTFDAEAIFMEELAAPVIAPVYGNGQDHTCQISVSTGFIDLINHLAHAKAIDRIQPGYLRRYVANLAEQGENEIPASPPNVDDARYWTDKVMIDQASFFNQMISITLALNLSHQYLAHYNKYAAQMPDGKQVPVNNFIAPGEWKASVRYATLNSLDCALATEGAETLFNCIDQMPQRPAWTGYIVPEGVNIKKLNEELSQYEHDYYFGHATLLHPRRTVRLLASKNGSSVPMGIASATIQP